MDQNTEVDGSKEQHSQRELMPETARDQVGDSSKELNENTAKQNETLQAGQAIDSLQPSKLLFIVYNLNNFLGMYFTGFAIFGVNQIVPILEAKFKWDEQESLLMVALIANAAVLGVMIGSLISGPLIGMGRRKAILFCNLAAAVFTGLTLIETVPTILIGRLGIGICAGIANGCVGKSVFENVSSRLSGPIGSSLNVHVCVGGVIALLLGLTLPTEESEYAQDEFWRLNFAILFVFIAIQSCFYLFLFKYEPIDFSIKLGKDKDAYNQVALIYKPAEAQKDKPRQEVFEKYVAERKQELLAADKNAIKVTLKEALVGSNYWRGTWVSTGVAISVQFSCIGPLVTQSTSLMITLKEKSGGTFEITPQVCTVILGVLNPIMSSVGILSYTYMGRKTNILIGHTLLMLCHIMIGVCMVAEKYYGVFVFIILFETVFQVFVGNLSFLYPAEVGTDISQGIATGGLFATMLTLSLTVQFMVASSLGISGTFWVYAFLNFICIFYDIFIVKETKGKTALELKELYLPKNRVQTAKTPPAIEMEANQEQK